MKKYILIFICCLSLISFIYADIYSDCTIYGNCNPVSSLSSSCSGSCPLNDSYVPYVGANKNVNLGIYNISTNLIHSNTFATYYGFDMLSGFLLNSNGNNVISLDGQIYDSSILNTPSLNFHDRSLTDNSPSHNNSLDWDNRFLLDNSGNIIVDWSSILNVKNITVTGNAYLNYLNVSSTATIDNIQFNKYGTASRILLPTNSFSYIGTDTGATWLGYCTGDGIWFFGVASGDIVVRGTNTKRLHLGVDNPNANAYPEMTFDINGIAVNTNYSVVAPSSRLNLPKGDVWANRSALKFTASPLLLTPEAGAIEYNATDIFITNNTNVRLKFATFNASKSGISAKGSTCTITEITNGIITGGSCV